MPKDMSMQAQPQPRYTSGTVAADAAMTDILTKSYNGYADFLGFPRTDAITAAAEGKALFDGASGLAAFARNPSQYGRGLRKMGAFAEAAQSSPTFQKYAQPVVGKANAFLDRVSGLPPKVAAPKTEMYTPYEPPPSEAKALRGLLDRKRGSM
jgi:hypothetical protein